MKEDYVFLSLTLTVKNCSSDELGAVLDHLFEALDLFKYSEQIKNAFRIRFKAIEVSHCSSLPASLRFHPHVHLIVSVNRSDFLSGSYPSKNKIAVLWQQACGLDYTPVVEVKKI